MTLYKIPLNNVPEVFEIEMVGVTYRMTCKFNDATEAGWTLDIADANGDYLVANIPLVTGADLLAQYQYLNFGCSLFVVTDGSVFSVPTLDNLGSESNLYLEVA